MQSTEQARLGRYLAIMGLVLMVAAGILFGASQNLLATSDYTVPDEFYEDIFVGSAGAHVFDASTDLDEETAIDDWNDATTNGDALVDSVSAFNCGITVACTVMGEDGTNITINGEQCTFNELGGSGGFVAGQALSSDTIDNVSGCDNVSTDEYPVFFLTYNDGHGDYPFSSDFKRHIAMHEIGHIALDDISHTCWTSTVRYPLMENPCSSLNNYTPTSNEADAMETRNGW